MEKNYQQRNLLQQKHCLKADSQPSTGLSSGSSAEEREEGRTSRSQGLQEHDGEPTETVDLNSWEFMDSGPTVRGACMRLILTLCTYVTVVKLGFFVRLLVVRLGSVPGI